MTTMQKINNRLDNILLGGGGLGAEPGEISFRTYIEDPENLYKPDSVLAYDRAASAAIARLESFIVNLKEYRMALGQRYNYLAMSPTIQVVRLTAENDGKRLYYYLKIYRQYNTGEEYEESGRQYNEDERELAIEEFRMYQKTHPGIKSEMSIDF